MNITELINASQRRVAGKTAGVVRQLPIVSLFVVIARRVRASIGYDFEPIVVPERILVSSPSNSPPRTITMDL